MLKHKLKVMTITGLVATSMALGLTPSSMPFFETKEAHAASISTHKVQKGDTLYGLSRKHKVSVANLKSWNGLKSDVIKIGQVLKVSSSSSKPTPAPTQTVKTYKVKRGDTLYGISRTYKVTVDNIKKWNSLKSNTIYTGQTLKVQSGTPAAVTPPKATTPKVTPASFKTVRYYDTNIHVYTSASNAKLAISKGKVGKLEPLSTLKAKNEVAKVNMGFFDFGGKFEHGGMYMVNGSIQNNYNERYMTMVYGKNGKIDINNFGKSLSKSALDDLKKNAVFAVGTSYSLVQDGKKNLQNVSRFTPENIRNPRTMFGQTKDGRFILAVTDGRVSGSKGLSAVQSADVMLKLGAVEAANFDGGGSSTLIVNGKIKNKLAGGQRSIGSALFVVN